MKYSSKDEIIKTVYELMLKNRRTAGSYQYTVPSPQTYPYQWLWDSCFHAIILSHCNVEDAKKELLSLVSHQFDNGMLPHMIYWEQPRPFGTLLTDVTWGGKDTSTITQPPIIADAVLKIYEQDQDWHFLKEIYPKLKKFYKYLLIDRDARGNHLIGIINPDESGEDNSPRFDIPLKLPAIQTTTESIEKRLKLVEENKTCNFDAPKCMKNFFWVKDLPYNCFMVKNLLSLYQIAKILKLEEDRIIIGQQAELIKQAMRTNMYEDGLYWSVFGLDYKKIKVKTWAIFAPLYAGILSQQEAEYLVDQHLLNKKEFWPKYPIPTVSLDEPSFDPQGYWRGPTWIAINWFVFQGLLNYGFKDIAKEIYRISNYLIETKGFREQFDPQTGEGLGAQDFTWGGLIVDMGPH